MKIKKEEIVSFFSSNFKQLAKPAFLALNNISLGLDIGGAYVKAIALEKNNQDITIIDFVCEKAEEDIKGTLSKVFSGFSVKKKELNISVSGQSVVLRYINLPIMSNEDLAKSMDFEVEKHIPFKKDEINFDFTALKRDKNAGKMLVLIVAAKKELVDSKVSTLRELGYYPNVIDACPLAIANFFEFASDVKQGVCALVNLGATFSSVDIIEDGLLALSRDIFIGGNDFTRKISEVTSKSIRESEQIKLKSLEDDLLQSLEPIFNNLARELKASFDFYETQADRIIDKILITGGSSQLKGLMEFFRHFLGDNIEAIAFNSDKFKLGPSLNLEDFNKNFNFYSVALGLALRNY